MPKQSKAQAKGSLPKDVRAGLNEAEKALREGLSTGVSPGVARRAEQAMTDALRAVREIAGEVEYEDVPEVDLTGVLAESIRGKRLEADWTQQQLAEEMKRAGFNWNRAKVTEVERRGGRVSWSEWIGLAAVFRVPALTLLLPDEEAKVRLNDERTAPSHAVLEVLVGLGGTLGSGGPGWMAPERVRGEP